MIRIGILISHDSGNMMAIHKACERQTLIEGEVVFVGSDEPGVDGLDYARENDIPTFFVDYRSIMVQQRMSPGSFMGPTNLGTEEKGWLFSRQGIISTKNVRDVGGNLIARAVAEAALLCEMQKYDFDLLVLAGFMRKLTPYFIDRVNTDPAKPRIMNIHSSLLPSFRGRYGYEDTFNHGCKVGGCTVHFVDYGENTGPIIDQISFPIEPKDRLYDVERSGRELEWLLYPSCIQLFAEGRLQVIDGPNGRGLVNILGEGGAR
jgi:phosphoribosylglycinamide formyltransferase-1